MEEAAKDLISTRAKLERAVSAAEQQRSGHAAALQALQAELREARAGAAQQRPGAAGLTGVPPLTVRSRPPHAAPRRMLRRHTAWASLVQVALVALASLVLGWYLQLSTVVTPELTGGLAGAEEAQAAE